MFTTTLDIVIDKDPYDDGIPLFESKTITISSNQLTVICGCNGSGKSTLLQTIAQSCKNNGMRCLYYDNLTEGHSYSKSLDLLRGDMSMLASKAMSSEGEETRIILGHLISKIGSAIRDSKPESSLVVIIDALDSGYSLDNVVEFKDAFNDLVFMDAINSGINLYLVVSANTYEMCSGEDCIDAKTLKHISFEDYPAYKDYILERRRMKDLRYEELNWIHNAS